MAISPKKLTAQGRNKLAFQIWKAFIVNRLASQKWKAVSESNQIVNPKDRK